MQQSTGVRRVRGWRLRLMRELAYSDRAPLVVMVAFTIAVVVGGLVSPDVLPYTTVVLPMFVGSIWLGPKTLPWFVIFCLLGVVIMVSAQPVVNSRTIVRLLVTFAVGLLILFTSFQRSRLGVSGPRSESMFVDLRDRIAKQGQLPQVSTEWLVESATRSAGGTAFAGDFVVASQGSVPGEVELGVVDVSGKGVEAGTRALLLSGAFGGLLSALPAEGFLDAANDYLLRQGWTEGFATAIHLHLKTDSGDFELRKAGHPPGVWLKAGSGTWQVLESEGPVLGLIPDTSFEVVRGTIRPGDALLLYTDGLVETTRRDIGSGIDKLAGRAQLLMQGGFEGGAEKIIDALQIGNDDRALVLVHRR